MFNVFGAVLIALAVAACTSISPAVKGSYTQADASSLYGLTAWRLEGRLAVVAPNDTWSAGLEWRHLPVLERLKLSGPLGQGGVAIELNGAGVTIDRGGGNIQTSNEPEKFISRQLGLEVPIHSLRFWAVGLPEADCEYQKTADGFVQNGWLIVYKEMQQAGKHLLPRKMTISKNNMRLKLIIDQWDLNGDDAL